MNVCVYTHTPKIKEKKAINFKETKGCGPWKGLKGGTRRGKLGNYNYQKT